jgi:4-amino-4-deoxy-L-arabinose transferase-like glycosyltransferase
MTVSSIQNPKSKTRNALWWMVGILLLAAAFRFLAVDSAPPGWRDDELIEFNMDRRIADGWRPLFITEAEGHEPVYHYLHAGTITLFGDNIVGYKWLPFACGLLTIALTYALAKKMFGENPPGSASRVAAKQSFLATGEIASSRPSTPLRSALDVLRNDRGVKVALLAAALMAVSFWPVMYSRFGVRHIGVLPWMLTAMYLLYPAAPTPALPRFSGVGARGVARVVLAGLCLAAAIMTYFAGRAVPLILIGFLIYLAVFNRLVLRQVWWRYLLALGLAALIVLPMFVEIASTPGGEKRTEVVGGPLIELRKGNVQPAIETTLGTLGMFTFAGDPEWLYNVENRPVFDWITGLFFYLGVIICLLRLKRIESGLALVWLIVGLAPAFVSIPAASFSHTIAALPVVYMLAALGVVELVDKIVSRQGNKRLALSAYLLAFLLVVGLGAWLTIRDYFGTWANEYIVRFQYHAPTREVARWLDQHPEITDVAIGTNLNELTLDPLALRLDMPHDIPVSWFNAESAVARSVSGPTVFTALQAPGVEVRSILSRTAQLQTQAPEVEVYTVDGSAPVSSTDRMALADVQAPPATVKPGQLLTWQTHWLIASDVSQPRLKMFLHLLNDKGEVVLGDDREDLNFATLSDGSSFWQISRLTLPGDLPPGQYPIEVGWYNPVTGERFTRADGSDRYPLSPLEVTAP